MRPSFSGTACAALLLAIALLPNGSASAQAQPLPNAPVPPSAPLVNRVALRELVRLVKQTAGRLDAAHVRALVRRARLSGLAPTLRLSAERGLKQDLSSSTTSDAERLASAVGDALSLEASLTFDLPRLVFAPEEVRLASVERLFVADQRKLVEEAIHLYFQRHRWLLERRNTAQPSPELEAKIAEAEALLDAMTQGAFRAWLR